MTGAIRITSAERRLLEDMPEEKQYLALRFIADLTGFIGKAMIVFSVVWFVLLVIGLLGMSFEWNFLSTITSTLPAYVLLPPPFVAIAVGIGYIAMSESIRLFIDLQANADRQSITLTLILRRLLEKGNP